MSVDFARWLRSGGGFVATQIPMRAVIQESRTLDKQTDIRLRRGNTELEPQTVRIELEDSASGVSSAAGLGAVRKATIFGVRGHPELDDTDILKGDRFVMDGADYRVVSVNTQMHGQVQAYCEAVG